MADKVMTLYFKDTGIKLLIARGKKTEQWASVSLEPGLVVGGVIANETTVADKVREIFATIKHSALTDLISGKGKLIVGLSGRDSLYRVISLPVLEKSLLPEAVKREAARVLPVALDQLYLAYQRIPGGENETRIFLVAFPKNSTDVLLKTLRLAGVTPRMLDLAPLALCLSVNEPMAIIADASLDTLNIMVMVDRVPQVIRSISLQSEGKKISENMAIISEEFSRTVAFYNSSHQQAPLSNDVPVFVSGDLAAAFDTWKILVGKMNSKVAVLPLAVQYPEDFPANDFTVNLALAAKVLALDKVRGNYSLVNLNAMPESAKAQPINPYRILVPVVAVVGIVLVIIMWNNLQSTRKNTPVLQTQVTAKQALITSNNKAVADLTQQNRVTESQIAPIVASAQIFPAKLSNMAAARALTQTQIGKILSLRPLTVSFSGISYIGAADSVTGTSGTSADVLSYAQALRDTGDFTTVVSTITYSPQTTDSGDIIPMYSFTLQIN
jgi:type IV pilus assembly protein PilM